MLLTLGAFTIYTNSNFLSVPPLWNNCQGIVSRWSYHESWLEVSGTARSWHFQLSLCPRTSTPTIRSAVTYFFYWSSIVEEQQFILKVNLFSCEKENIYSFLIAPCIFIFLKRNLRDSHTSIPHNRLLRLQYHNKGISQYRFRNSTSDIVPLYGRTCFLL